MTSPEQRLPLPAGEMEQQGACTVCGEVFPANDLAWTGSGLLCPFCLAEKESCGCSD
ncbi:hypothetical protein ACUUL3_14265 [Thiovibrio sp. JS02]